MLQQAVDAAGPENLAATQKHPDTAEGLCRRISCIQRIHSCPDVGRPVDQSLLRVPPGRGLAIHGLMDQQRRLIGSAWFTSREGQEMVGLLEAGLLDLSALEHPRILLEGVNEAIGGIARCNGGFSNFIISPLGTS